MWGRVWSWVFPSCGLHQVSFRSHLQKQTGINWSRGFMDNFWSTLIYILRERSSKLKKFNTINSWLQYVCASSVNWELLCTQLKNHDSPRKTLNKYSVREFETRNAWQFQNNMKINIIFAIYCCVANNSKTWWFKTTYTFIVSYSVYTQ